MELEKFEKAQDLIIEIERLRDEFSSFHSKKVQIAELPDYSPVRVSIFGADFQFNVTVKDVRHFVDECYDELNKNLLEKTAEFEKL